MKIEFHYEGVANPEVIAAHIEHAHGLDLPYPKPTGRRRLAVMGGGPSVADHIEEIRHFDGDLWIIGSCYPWARQQGLDGVYFNIDPSENCAVDCAGAGKAILGSAVHPAVFAVLREADVSVFDLIDSDSRLNHGVTTATAVPELALILDYTDIVFYGCESSFSDDMHAYEHEVTSKWLVVESDGKTFSTRPDYFAQAEFLATIIRRFPQYFSERSGGFLRAMVSTMEWEFTHATRALYETLTFNQENQNVTS